ncbi:hypothetical protein PH552_12175 [Rhizobium sp. CNPSo 3968]|uniref:hypothetical protein n=1 Tax=Rhizobium sp. CNPSo 3968 TaxID=3021408 RepID=UPI00254A534D|nr:hypothetical protein [Rhizobium sp. CNPSo 3968]MDK4720101.1 hypothetical protein [Rhizobium sp. CNPSo 3968]
MDSMLVGFGYVAAAFGLCLLAIGAGVVAWRGARLIMGQRFDAANAGAIEGDGRSFRTLPDDQ